MTPSVLLRLQNEKAGSRELDELVALHLGWQAHAWSGAGGFSGADWTDPQGKPHDERVPKFTRSLDAALTLVPEGMEWEISTLYHLANVTVGLNTDNPQHVRREDGNVILALVIASLMAMETK